MAHLRMIIALRLGQTLGHLGHQEEAHHVLEEAYSQAPSNPEIARGYAQVLLAEGELNAALMPLETILNSQTADLQAYLDYAGCMRRAPPAQ